MAMTQAQMEAAIKALQADDSRVQTHITELYERANHANKAGERLVNELQVGTGFPISEWTKP